ncbi:MAG TPA: sulfotransferase [Solirubrobacterales bacterium]|nr:sulfotransferase [Solirubrobacterales bacterium]
MPDLTATVMVSVDSVEVNQGESDYVHGGNLDSPTSGLTSDSYGLALEGWLLSKRLAVEHVEVLYEERAILTVPLDVERQDIAAGFPEVEGAERSGYRARIGALKLPPKFELVLRAKLEDGTRLPLALVRGRRRSLPVPGGEDLIQPLMVNTVGRSGSTLLVTMLSSHPDVVAFSPFIKDARVSTYWASVLQDLAEPSSFLAAFDPPDLEKPHWWLDSNAAELGDPEVEHWLGNEAVDLLAGNCRAQIEAFYSHLAGEEGARFFVEKYLPYQVVPDLLAEIYPGAREVILVRDFRDQLCSVIAFNRKRGWSDFGHTEGGDDAEYVRNVMRPSLAILAERLRSRETSPWLVRYEDLVLDPEPTLAGLFEHLGLPGDPELVSETVRRAQESTAEMHHHRTTSDPAASIGRWREDLPEDVAAVCSEELGDLLIEFGYEE